MSYEKLKSVDGIEFTPLKEPEQANIEPKLKQIDIESQNILFSKASTSITCCICLENNDKTSIKLKCICSTKIHSACIDEMKKNNITKCPICYNNVLTNDKDNFSNNLLLNIMIIIILPIYFYYVLSMSYGICSIILYPSTSKYCDNNHKMCEYFHVDGILVSNVIKEKYDNFNVKYYLSSSYNWTTNDLGCGTCYDLDTHTYDTYETALIIKEKSINEIKSFFVSYSNPINCKVTYKWDNSNKYHFYLSCIYSAKILLFTSITQVYFNYKYRDIDSIILPTNNILECILNKLFLIIYLLFMACWIVSMLIVDYYAYFYK